MPRMTIDEYEGQPWEDVDSSNIRRVSWSLTDTHDVDDGVDVEVGTLIVEFHGGRAYTYADVAEDTYQELLEADSAGGYLNHEVKPSHACERIEVATQ
jgi:hypothetical protein